MPIRSTHVAVIGAGSVGATIAYALLLKGMCDRLTLIDVDESKVGAEVLDLNHGLEFMPTATVAAGTDVGACLDADVVVLTAGARQRAGQPRLDLAGDNATMCRAVVPAVLAVAPDAVVLVVTNPVDVITHVAANAAGERAAQVLGSGTVLDSSRLRYLLARACGVAVPNVHAHVVGEHGDSEFVLWSSASIGGLPIDRWTRSDGEPMTADDRARLAGDVRDAAYRIIAGKGATNLAIGVATARIVDAILHDERRVLPVTAPLRGEFGQADVSLSLPRIVGARGAGAVLPISLSDAELDALTSSAEAVRAVLQAVGSNNGGRS
jgi:L-lactate dehydrogenase